ncbi:2'-5'-oligoadenylate synthase 3 isoform X3 [Peromyscus maniculatus bairdii]|uniref:2'-5'-oligoadenylate synthase 3 isoform X3 n=1 Tax=Peromyscus maniculatus bairdii TaxID=230844 RepID=UPI003FD224D5
MGEEEMPALPASSGHAPRSPRRNETLLRTQINMDLYHTPARALDKLVAHSLHPSPEFTAAVRGALGSLDTALRERGDPGSQRPRVIRIAKGGAYARGTALRGGCDAELVVFLNCFRSYGDQKTGHTETLGTMRALLESWGRHPGGGLTFQFSEPKASGVLQFRLTSADQENWMDVSLVPAFDVLGQPRSGVKPTPEVYASLVSSGCQPGEHTACFTELRRNFVNNRPAKLKNLILLVKHWYRQVQTQETPGATLPPSYALELLTIFAWEQGCRKDNFSLAQGLRTVLALIQQNKSLCIFWTENYDFGDPAVGEFLRRQLERPRPVILDPADPTWDVGNGTAWRWDVLAKEAESCFKGRCFLQAASGAPEQPWEGPGLPRAGVLGLDHPIQQRPSQALKANKGLSAVQPRAGHPQPSHPAQGLLEAAIKVAALQNPTACKVSKNLKKTAPPRTVHETVLNVSSHVQITQSTPSSNAPLGRAGAASISGSVLGPDLSQIPSKELDSFIQDHLRPSPQFQQQVRQAIDTILRCLLEKCLHKASRVSKGGSFGRGTDLRGSCDVELVVFYNVLRDFKDQRSHQTQILGELRTQLQSWWQAPVPGLSLQLTEQNRPNALQLRLASTDLNSWVDISVLPAFDAVGQLKSGDKPQPQVYASLLSSGCQAGEHAACFAELRRNFVNNRPAKLKNLMLLVKHWYGQVATRDKGGEAAGAALPPAYALELLTIFAWEQGCGKQGFSMAEGLRTILRLVQQHRSLCVYWTVNYSVQDPALRAHLLSQLQKARPLVLDPADPTWNVGQGSWELLAREAAALESQVCLQSGDGTPVPPWDVMPALLHQTPAGDLDKFISEFLQPDRHFLTQVKKAVDTICSFLKENCFRNSSIKVLKVVKGGSSAKGTALRGRSDADLVVFLSCFSEFSKQGSHRAEIISEIRAQLEACQQEQKFDVKFEISNRKNPRVLSFSLASQTLLDQSVDFDVLPAFDALGQLRSGSRPDPRVYADLIHSYSNAGEFSTCFTELQRDFISSRPTKLKSLIRLVKHWYQQCDKAIKGKGSLPPQHGLELLTVYAWEQGGQNPQFNMAEGFRTVLELVVQYRQLCIYWTVNYSAEDKTIGDFLRMQLQKPRPIILDPADPTGNLGHSARWDLLAQEAAVCTSALCCMDKSGTPIKPWLVKPTSLFITPSHLLNKFIEHFLQPDKDFLDQIKRAVHTICKFLKENCFQDQSTKVLKTVKGGSTAKGTALKSGSDADIVVFLSSLKSYDSQQNERSMLVREIHRQLEDFQKTQELEVKFEISKWEFPRVLSFTLKSRSLNESVDFDVLPAYDALGQLRSGFPSRPEAYKELIELYKSSNLRGGEFSPCFTELQRNFIEPRPTKLKSLIRLIKHWYKQCQRKKRSKASLPPKYALELLTVYAWEQGSGMDEFDIAEGFRTVLDLVINYQQLCIFWTVNYNFENEPMRSFLLTQIRKTRCLCPGLPPRSELTQFPSVLFLP